MLGVTVRLPSPGVVGHNENDINGQAPGSGAEASGVAGLGEIGGETQRPIGVDDDRVDAG